MKDEPKKIPQYEVIADFPKNDIGKVGDIIDAWPYMELDKYPHLFRRIGEEGTLENKARDLALQIASFLEANNCTLCIETAEGNDGKPELELFLWKRHSGGAEGRYIHTADFLAETAEITAEELRDRHG